MEEALSFLTVFFFLSDGGINTVDYYYYLLLYCSSAGMGLTRDSALRPSLRATTWCLLILKDVVSTFGRLCYPRLRRGRCCRESKYI